MHRGKSLLVGNKPALIEAIGLRKNFGSLEAVRGIDLSVVRGEVLGFLGPNGAGKWCCAASRSDAYGRELEHSSDQV